MEDVESKAAKDVPFFEKKCRELHQLVIEMLDGEHNVAGNNFAFMALCFISKQLEHMESVLTLEGGKHYRDMALVVRSMIEGFAQLAYAYEDPPTRAKVWFEFSSVSSWRKMKKEIERGYSVDPQKQKNVRKILEKWGAQFLNKKGMNEYQRTKVLPGGGKLYVDKWVSLSYSQMIRQLDAGVIEDFAYGPFSEWHHWSPEGVGRALQAYGNGAIGNAPGSLADAAISLTNAFQWLHEMAKIVNAYLRLGFDDRLNEISKAYKDRPSVKGPSSS